MLPVAKTSRIIRLRIGYVQASTNDQTLVTQRDALTAAGCEKIFADRGVSGALAARPGLDSALKALQPGDTLVVWKLNRLGRSLVHLVHTIAELGERGIGFQSLDDPIDTTSASGRLVLHITAAFAEFERSLATERTRAGLVAAKRRGVKFGRKPTLTEEQIAHARSLIERGESPRMIARTLRVHRSTLYRHLPTGCQPGANATAEQRKIPNR